jgi:pimeloyl-ACP methyl ester carboxylesterase
MSPSSPTQHHVQCITPGGLHRLAWWQWGDPANPRVLVCAHGLTRGGRDFDELARVMAPHYRVVCPDFPGRGASDWLRNPAEYQVPIYVADAVTLLARLDAQVVDWVGTSMGGLIGMTLAALADTPIRRLVINDVGAVLPGAALERIGAYVGANPHFATIEAAEARIRQVHAPFGPHSDAQWRHLTEVSVRPAEGGGYRLHYDPAIAAAFAVPGTGQDIDLWALYEAIRCPVLLLRGAQSDLLPAPVARGMTERGPRARLIEFDGVGHAPSLMAADQVAAVREFLLGA